MVYKIQGMQASERQQVAKCNDVTHCYGALNDVTHCYGALNDVTHCYGALF